MRSQRPIAATLVLSDIVSLVLVFNLVGWLRGIVFAPEWIFAPLFLPLAFVLTGFYLIDGYKAQTDLLSLDYTSQHLIAVLAGMIATLLTTFAILPEGYPLQQSRAVIALSFVLYMPLSLSYRRLSYRRESRQRRQRALVFVGDESSCTLFAEECAKMEFTQPVLYATLASSQANPTAGLTAFDETLTRLEKGEIEVEALVLRETSNGLTSEFSQRLVELYFRGVPTYTLELFHQVYWRKIPLYRLNQTWLFQEGFKIAREPVFERLKRLSDIFLSSLGILVGAPIFILAGLAVWLDDRGPVFFRQTRIGKNRVPFRLLKFRTMRANDGREVYTKIGDSRITRVGKFLRASRIDEFPQMFNVLRGEMSFIGPRAEWDRLVVDYERQIPCYHFRHLVKPGITGWAQVNYPYGANLEDTIRKLEYDLYYIRHFSFAIDAAIVLKTIHIMLFGKGR